MNSTVLTPFFTFIVGVIGGLILGFCLCYLWMKNRIAEDLAEENDKFDDVLIKVGYPLSNSNEQLTEVIPPYLLDIGWVDMREKDQSLDQHPAPQVSQTHQQSIIADGLSLVHHSLGEESPIGDCLRPLKSKHYIDEFTIPDDQSFSLKRQFFSMDDWEKSLKTIHLNVNVQNEGKPGLSRDAWLDLGLAVDRSDQSLNQPPNLSDVKAHPSMSISEAEAKVRSS